MSICPQCGSRSSKVTDSRDVDGGRWRKRYCRICKSSFDTIELPARKSNGKFRPDMRVHLASGQEPSPMQAEILRIVERFGPIQTDRIVNLLYSDRPDGGPLTAAKNIHVHIHKINRRLGPTITWDSAGYRLVNRGKK